MNPRIFLALAAAVLASPSSVAQPRPFDVDIMVQTEGVAEALFAPGGAHLLVEKTTAYQESRSFAWQVWSRDRASLLRVDVERGSGPEAVAADPRERIWLGAYSPSGAKAAVGWFDGDVAKTGVYDLATGALSKFDLLSSVSYPCAFDCPFWLSEDEFVHYAPSADVQKKSMSGVAYSVEMMDRWARQSWEGKQPVVKVSGSGAYQGTAVEEGGTLLRVDARSGRATPIGDGRYLQMSLSPDRRRFAVVEETGNLPIAGAEVKAIIGADKVARLTVYDFAGQRTASVVPCDGCNVTRDSLRWSPGGGKLFFSARTTAGGKQVHEHYIYDFARAGLQRYAPEGVAFEVEENLRRATYVVPFVWLTDESAAVRVLTRKASTPQDKDRYDWYALPPGGAPVALTAGLAAEKDEFPLQDYVTVRDGKLLLMADGELWQLGADGTRRNLTEGVAEAVSPWCSVVAYWREAGARPICSGFRPDAVVRLIEEAALARGRLTFRLLQDDVATGDLLFLDLESGRSMRLAAPAPDAELVTASAEARTALYRRKGDDGDRLLLVRAEQPARELLHFNRQLAGVAGGQAVMLTRREAGENEDRYDWLLLPPDHQPGDRHPLLVYFYPDTKYTKEWRSDDLRSVSFLNQHIPAAHGFAVLLASMKISSMEERGDPMTEMHGQLVRAAENVVAQGYADPVRWAIMGHSYGGYGTNGVITQTDRFKAAVALAGPVNLTSGYAIGLSQGKATEVASGLSFGAMWSEGGQGRMGVAPWQDPERYVRNSPLFHADQVNTPLMLVHGEYDFVDVGQAEEMFNALHRQGKDAVFLRYWGENHVITSPANIRDMWQRIFGWFDEHLDIARDERGRVRFDGHRVRSRHP